MNGYVCFYRDKRIEVQSNTTLDAQVKAAAQFKARRRYEVVCVLAECNGEQVVHIATE
jgi:hypothetical protein